LDVFEEEQLARRSLEMGRYFLNQLKQIQHPAIREVRGRGLFIGVECHGEARPYCEALKEKGVLCKETHKTTIRFAPPLNIAKDELDWAFVRIREIFEESA